MGSLENNLTHMKYRIVDTPMWPCRWHVQAIGCRIDNATHLFFRTYEEALKWIKARGGSL